MINIVVPMAGSSFFFDEKKDGFIKPFIEICGKTMLELFIENYAFVKDKRFIFILKEEDVRSFHLDEAIGVLTDHKAEILLIKNETAGMLCSALFAIEKIGENEPLLVVNSDQIFEFDINATLKEFKDYDAGVLSFESIHPRFAYVKCDEENLVLEAFEKRPMSKNAVAGFYYFKQGSFFIEAAKNTIRKDMSLNGKFFIAPLLNELILQNKKILNVKIDKNAYHTFYSKEKISEYERVKNA
ncbi:glycosyl transferase family 2 [Campylobacter vulpis]|uniref:Glycosyl transferase family 2 n=1 Tax=Campylobacter vulpis TaxID=1655500 RepID=A0A2G4QYT7_9BACT|nr:glycosyltransferase family 2 protein [Campylobacter vulpis]MBS4240959.1 glycosyl transferase family 2 [Campylobacter vulpis]MBS4252872.1 glycosyl transferase family 2 [Campylobacter vulpis]MBS4282159.1 glycosyl transferase family 2 [Campylobacter vulpis]MBS4313695.1 glycosyl transferase family 2 [Campylobacter vulpis]MBS4331316.1 glycosyl transferase family 2 [Campylobacter vulpis]